MQYEIKKSGKYVFIHLVGNISSEVNSAILEEEISDIANDGGKYFVFNLEKTQYLDSSGIGIFIYCLSYAQENDGKVFIIAEESPVREVLHLVGLDRLIEMYNSEDDFWATNE